MANSNGPTATARLQARRLERLERAAGETELMLAMSPMLTSGYYSESLSQSVSSRLSRQLQRRRASCAAPDGSPTHDEGVIIEAGLSFVLPSKSASHRHVAQRLAVSSSSGSGGGGGVGVGGSGGQSRRVGVSHHFRPMAAHAVERTQSSALSRSIREFLGRTDHVMNEWKQLDREAGSVRGRSSSRSFIGDAATDPCAKGYRSVSVSSRLPGHRSRSGTRRAPSFTSFHSRDSSHDTIDWHSAEDSEFYDLDDTNYDEVGPARRRATPPSSPAPPFPFFSLFLLPYAPQF